MNIVITGASSGLGLHTAQALARHGHRVIAGARSFTEEREDLGFFCAALDVTDQASIEHFHQKAIAYAGQIDAVVHCAGILMLGSCEETTPEEYLHIMDTDFLGMVRVNQAFLPDMRAQHAGRIVMFSSINGLLGIPFQSAYTAAKHAVEGYAECLQMETKPFGISICLVEPGDHQSGSEAYRHHTSGMQADSPYRQAFTLGTRVIRYDENHGSDPDRLGEKVAKLLERRRMPFRVRIASADQHLAVVLHDILPPSLNNRILSSYYLKPGKKNR